MHGIFTLSDGELRNLVDEAQEAGATMTAGRLMTEMHSRAKARRSASAAAYARSLAA